MRTPTAALVFLLTALTTTTSAACLHGTSLDPRRIIHGRRAEAGPGGNKTVAVKDFGYTGDKGPLMWHTLSPDNAACRTGRTQSPINLSNSTIERTSPGAVKLSVPDLPNGADIENLGTTVEVVMEGLGGKVEFGGREWEVQQFHFHAPSEHRLEEEFFPLELHMVTEGKTADGRPEFLVLAMLFQLVDPSESPAPATSAPAAAARARARRASLLTPRDHPTSPTTLLTTALSNLPVAPGSVVQTPALTFTDVAAAVAEMPFFHYIGSLTTPPCSEGVTFLVTQKPMGVDVKTFNAVKKVMKFNSRFTQAGMGEQNLLQAACA